MGTVSGSGTYNEDAQVTLTATPNTGYHFVNWTKAGSVVSTAASYSFTATAETAGDYIANFAINTYTLTLSTNPTDGSLGTLDVARNSNSELPAGVTGEYPEYTVDWNTSVPLVADPIDHYHLAALTDEEDNAINFVNSQTDNTATATINITGDTSITGAFTIDTYTLTLEADGTGTVVAGLKYFSISNNQQVYFAKGNLQHVGNSWQFAEHQYDYFGEDQTHGSDMFGFNQYTCPDGWYCLSRDQWDYILNTRTANNSLFNGARYTLATVNNVKGMIIFPDNYIHPSNTGFVAGTYNAPSDYTATVGLEGWEMMEAAGCVFLPAAGCHIDGSTGWYRVGLDGDYMSTTNYIGTTVYDNKYYATYFKYYNVTVDDWVNSTTLTSVRLVSNTSPQQEVIVDNHDGTYTVNYGTTVSVMAIPAANYYFKNWNNEAVINSNEAVTTTFTVTKDTTLTAHFIPATKGVSPEGALTVEGGRFVSETGEIVGLPRLTETGEIIDYENGGSNVTTVNIGGLNLQIANGESWSNIVAHNSDKLEIVSGQTGDVIRRKDTNKILIRPSGIMETTVSPSENYNSTNNYAWSEN